MPSFHNGQDVGISVNEQFLILQLDFGSSVVWQEYSIADVDGHLELLALLIGEAGSNFHDSPVEVVARLLEDDARGGFALGLDLLHEDSVQGRQDPFESC